MWEAFFTHPELGYLPILTPVRDSRDISDPTQGSNPEWSPYREEPHQGPRSLQVQGQLKGESFMGMGRGQTVWRADPWSSLCGLGQKERKRYSQLLDRTSFLVR